MNEELLKRAIQFKISTAEKILSRLPPETSENLRSIGNLIYESIAENIGNEKSKEYCQSKAPEKINNVTID